MAHIIMNRLSKCLAALRGGGAPAPAPAATATDTEVVDGYRAQAFADMLPELSAPGATPERLQYLHDHGVKNPRDAVEPLRPCANSCRCSAVRDHRRLRRQPVDPDPAGGGAPRDGGHRSRAGL